MTNRGKLKSMKHAELVIFFQKTGGCPPEYKFGHCPPEYTFGYCPAQDTPDAIIRGDYCLNCWSAWLKEEVEEDGNQ